MYLPENENAAGHERAVDRGIRLAVRPVVQRRPLPKVNVDDLSAASAELQPPPPARPTTSRPTACSICYSDASACQRAGRRARYDDHRQTHALGNRVLRYVGPRGCAAAGAVPAPRRRRWRCRYRPGACGRVPADVRDADSQRRIAGGPLHHRGAMDGDVSGEVLQVSCSGARAIGRPRPFRPPLSAGPAAAMRRRVASPGAGRRAAEPEGQEGGQTNA